jgi:hypothetical protein
MRSAVAGAILCTMRSAFLACGLVAVAVGAPAAHAAWSPPRPVSQPAADAAPVTLFFDSAQRPVAVWRGLTGADPDRLARFHALAARGPDGAWRPLRRFGSSTYAVDAAAYGKERFALAAWRQERVRGNRSRSRLVVYAARTTTAGLGRARTLALGPPRAITFEGPQPTILSPRVAGTPAGEIFVAWLRSAPASKAGVWLARRDAQGRWHAARRLGPLGGEPTLAADADGRVLVAWRRSSRRGRPLLEARVREPGAGWTEVERVFTGSQGLDLQITGVAAGFGRFDLGVMQTARSMAGVAIGPLLIARLPSAGWHRLELPGYSFTPTGENAFVTDTLRVLPLAGEASRRYVAWPARDGDRVRVAFAEVMLEGTQPVAGPVQLISAPDSDVALEDAAAYEDRLAVAWFDGAPRAWTGTDPPALLGTPAARALLGAEVAVSPAGETLAVWGEGSTGSGYAIVASSGP